MTEAGGDDRRLKGGGGDSYMHTLQYGSSQHIAGSKHLKQSRGQTKTEQNKSWHTLQTLGGEMVINSEVWRSIITPITEILQIPQTIRVPHCASDMTIILSDPPSSFFFVNCGQFIPLWKIIGKIIFIILSCIT